MTRRLFVLALTTLIVTACAHAAPTPVPRDTVVHIAPPTGESATDRASILAALEQVQPGGTVQFAPGTYLVGEIISVATPEIVLLGHPEGTTLRGCEWEDFQNMDQSMLVCNGLELAGARQTVRGITFENAFWSLHLGCCWSERRMYEWTDGSSFEGPVFRRTEGGHLVENNTFRSAGSGLRVNGDWTEPAVVRNNRFIDNWHAVSINGHTVHLLNNHISVPEPARVPFTGFPWDGIKISPPPPAWGEDGVPAHCTGNLIEGNHVEGHLDGIRIEVYFPNTACRANIVRENTVIVARHRNPDPAQFNLVDPSDSTFVGVPISILNDPMAFGEAGPGNESVIEGNVIEHNRIVGGEGVGVQVLHASRNRIADNEISGIVARIPFPGNAMGTWGARGLAPPWADVNGAGIWISPGSDENEIVGNTFRDIAGSAVYIEGDRNRVETRSASDTVRDLGRSNRVDGGASDTVHVAPPTGEREADRASILTALEQARPGGTVQFAQGTYLIGGEIIRVTVPRITLLGHPEGTTLRGCDPGEFPWHDLTEFGDNCNAIELAGGQQVVRNLNFEHAFWALHVGRSRDSPGMRGADGGHLIEGNTFRSSSNAVRVHGFWSEPTVIRNNRLLNNWHSVQIYGGTVHLLDNEISVPEPAEVQLLGFPMEGVHLARPFDLDESVERVERSCDNNVIAGNRIEGVTEGIMVTANEPGMVCRNNVIRSNTIIVRRARPPAMPAFIAVHDVADSTVVGVPLALRGVAGESTFEDNLIEGNIIVGAEGLGIEVRHASRNRIVNNTVTRVVRRVPFPGNSFIAMPLIGGDPQAWHEANGAGIWISPGSNENEVVGNTFEEIAGHAIVIEGDRNVVETRGPSDAVRDLGSMNRVGVAPSPQDPADEVRARTEAFLAALSDDSPTFVAPVFYAPDAVLELSGGIVLEGREAIVRDFLRPYVARLRGVRATSAHLVASEDTAVWSGTLGARFAPAADTIEAELSNTWVRDTDGRWLIASSTLQLPTPGDGTGDGPIRSLFFHSEGLSLHALDFGGAGVPIVFMPNTDRTAYTFIDFAPRFTDVARVLAVTSRWSGQSEGEADGAPEIAALGRDVIALLDSQGIRRAVVAHIWGEVLVYLAEQYPERVAGLVFLHGTPSPDFPRLWEEDATGALTMVLRLFASREGADPDAAVRALRERWYSADYLRTDRSIGVPALVFMEEGATAVEDEQVTGMLELARGVASDPMSVPDPVAREYFVRLAADPAAQQALRALYRDRVGPAFRAADERFRRAFGEHLQLVGTERQAVGYGYRNAPELIEPHIRRFLHELVATADSSRGPIIDMHIHAGPGNPRAQAYAAGEHETPDEARFRATLEEMDRNGVVLAMLSGPVAYTQLNQAAAPERFIAGMAFPCTDGLGPNLEQCFESGADLPDVEWLRGEIEAERVGALGELYNVYAGVSPLDSRMEPYWTLAAELDVPVAVHAERGPPPAARPEGCCPHFEGDYGNPALLKQVLERHPTLRLYLMHTVNPEFVSAAIELMDAYPNVYVDTSPMSLIPEFAVHAALRRMVKAGHADRILFGSDYLGAIGRSIEVIEAADFLTEEQKRAIYFDNAARFLRLNEEEIERHHHQVSVTRK